MEKLCRKVLLLTLIFMLLQILVLYISTPIKIIGERFIPYPLEYIIFPILFLVLSSLIFGYSYSAYCKEYMRASITLKVIFMDFLITFLCSGIYYYFHGPLLHPNEAGVFLGDILYAIQSFVEGFVFWPFTFYGLLIATCIVGGPFFIFMIIGSQIYCRKNKCGKL